MTNPIFSDPSAGLSPIEDQLTAPLDLSRILSTSGGSSIQQQAHKKTGITQQNPTIKRYISQQWKQRTDPTYRPHPFVSAIGGGHLTTSNKQVDRESSLTKRNPTRYISQQWEQRIHPTYRPPPFASADGGDQLRISKSMQNTSSIVNIPSQDKQQQKKSIIHDVSRSATGGAQRPKSSALLLPIQHTSAVGGGGKSTLSIRKKRAASRRPNQLGTSLKQLRSQVRTRDDIYGIKMEDIYRLLKIKDDKWLQNFVKTFAGNRPILSKIKTIMEFLERKQFDEKYLQAMRDIIVQELQQTWRLGFAPKRILTRFDEAVFTPSDI